MPPNTDSTSKNNLSFGGNPYVAEKNRIKNRLSSLDEFKMQENQAYQMVSNLNSNKSGVSPD